MIRRGHFFAPVASFFNAKNADLWRGDSRVGRYLNPAVRRRASVSAAVSGAINACPMAGCPPSPSEGLENKCRWLRATQL